jgi:hypothetical protein
MIYRLTCSSYEEQSTELKTHGYKLTGITAMDGRFEIVGEPQQHIDGKKYASPLWRVWDYEKAAVVSIGGPVYTRTKQRMIAQVAGYVEIVCRGELKREFDHMVGKPLPEISEMTRDSS